MAIVLTIDQRRSRRKGAAAAAWGDELNWRYGDRLSRNFEVTAGDEIQAVCDDSSSALEVTTDCLETQDWWVGLGVGSIEGELGLSARVSHGRAFEYARIAVAKAKRSQGGVAVRSRADFAERTVEPILAAIAFIYQRRGNLRRSPRWHAVELAREGRTMEDIGKHLGISHQAASSRLANAGWAQEQSLLALATVFLDRLQDDENGLFDALLGDRDGR